MDERGLAMMLWRGKHLILLAVLAMLFAGVGLLFTTSKSYEATTLLRVDQAAAPGNGSDAFNAQQASATQAVSYATLLTSTSFLQRVAPRIDGGFTFSGAALAHHIHAHAIKDTNLIALTFAASSRNAALRYARAVANEAINAFDADFAATRTRQQAALLARLKTVSARIAALQGNATPAAQDEAAALTVARNDLTTQYGQALSESSSPSSVVLVTGPPSAPADPVSPRPLLNLAIALFLGLLIGVGLAWMRERLTTWDRRVSSLAQALARDPLAAGRAGRVADRRQANKSDAAGTP
jgi:uncharacterized protein involved in exopolysaccharide biosynthesis